MSMSNPENPLFCMVTSKYTKIGDIFQLLGKGVTGKRCSTLNAFSIKVEGTISSFCGLDSNFCAKILLSCKTLDIYKLAEGYFANNPYHQTLSDSISLFQWLH